MSLSKHNFLEIERLKSGGTSGTKSMIVLDSANVKTNSRTQCVKGHTNYQTLVKVNDLTFVIIRILYSSAYTETEATATAIKLDPVTGAIATVGSPQQLWTNTSYGYLSTTQFVTVEGTGKFFAYGRNAYPGVSSSSYGYFWATFDEDGVKTNSGVTINNDYHGSTGQWGGMLDATGEGFYATCSSYSSDSKARQIKINYTGGIPNVSTLNPSSNTSTNYSTKFVSQNGVSNIDIVGICQFRTSSTAYKTRAFASDGAYTDFTRSIEAWGKESIGFSLSNGKVLVLDERDGNYAYSSRSGREKVEGFSARLVYSEDTANQITSVGVDTWVSFDRISGNLTSFHINPSTYKLTILDTKAIPLYSSADTFVKICGENNEFVLIVPRLMNNYNDVITLKHNLKLGA